MSEFPKIEDLYETGQSNAEPVKETNSPIENNEGKIEKKEKLPHTIEANFKTNPDGSIDITTEYGILIKKMPEELLPDDLRGKKNGELKITLTDHDTIAIKMLNQLLETPNKDE